MIAPDNSSDNSMNYAILGGGEISDEDKLAYAMGEVAWSYLAPHQLHGILYYVDPSLNLEDVGLAVAHNQTERVDAWLKSGDLLKLGALHAAQWENTDTRFTAMVVSPFVLCRLA